MGSSEQSTSRTTRSLKTFSNLNTDKEKAFYLCQGKRWVIQAFIDLFGHVLKKHIKLPPKILKQVKPFRKLMKVMTSKKSTLQLKKRYLCNVLSRSVFFPLLDKYLIPLGLKFFKKLVSGGHWLMCFLRLCKRVCKRVCQRVSGGCPAGVFGRCPAAVR